MPTTDTSKFSNKSDPNTDTHPATTICMAFTAARGNPTKMLSLQLIGERSGSQGSGRSGAKFN